MSQEEIIEQAVKTAKQVEGTREQIRKAMNNPAPKLNIKEQSVKIAHHIKGGIEKFSIWYEEYMLHTWMAGMSFGFITMMVAQLLAVSAGATPVLVSLYLIGGWVAIAPILFSLLYFATKFAVKIVEAAVNGIKKAHLTAPKIQEVVKEKFEVFKTKIHSGMDPETAAAQTA